MAFVLPTLNLLCNIFTSDAFRPSIIPTAPPRHADVECQLTYGRRVNVASTGGTNAQGYPLLAMNLLLPSGTDVRGPQDVSGHPDIVEVPAGSGRWYFCFGVDDIGKGFDNEHRTAAILPMLSTWTPPYG